VIENMRKGYQNLSCGESGAAAGAAARAAMIPLSSAPRKSWLKLICCAEICQFVAGSAWDRLTEAC